MTSRSLLPLVKDFSLFCRPLGPRASLGPLASLGPCILPVVPRQPTSSFCLHTLSDASLLSWFQRSHLHSRATHYRTGASVHSFRFDPFCVPRHGFSAVAPQPDAVQATFEDSSEALGESHVEPKQRQTKTALKSLEALKNEEKSGLVSASLVARAYKEIFSPGAPLLKVSGKLMSRSVDITSADALLLLKCFGRWLAEEAPENRVKMAEKAWQDLKAAGAKLDIQHYNALLKVYLDNEHHTFDPEDFLVIMSEDGIQLNNETYSLFVKLYCSQGDLPNAMRILEFMKSKDLPMTQELFCALIQGYMRKGDESGALNMLDIMKKSYGLQRQSFTPLLLGYAEKGDMDKVLKTVIDMKKVSRWPSTEEILEVLLKYLHWCKTSGNPVEPSAIDSLLEMAKEAGTNYDFYPGNLLARPVVELRSLGYPEIAVKVICMYEMPNKGELKRWENKAVWFLFKDALSSGLSVSDLKSFSQDLIEAGVASDPMRICWEDLMHLPASEAEAILSEANQSGAMTTEISQFLKQRILSRTEYAPIKSSLGIAFHLRMPFVNNVDFWTELIEKTNLNFHFLDSLFGHSDSMQSEKKFLEESQMNAVKAFVDYMLNSKRVDRLKILSDILNKYPNCFPDANDLVVHVTRRLHFKGTNCIDDALSILSKCPNLVNMNILYMLRGLIKKANKDKRNKDGKDVILRLIDEIKAGNLPCPNTKGVLELMAVGEDVEICEALIALIGSEKMRNFNWDWMSLEELLSCKKAEEKTPFQFNSKINLNLCKRAAAAGNEELVLKTIEEWKQRILPEWKQRVLTEALTSAIDMFCTIRPNSAKALEHFELLLKCDDEPTVSSVVVVSLFESLLKDGASLSKVLQLLQDLKQTNSKIKLPHALNDVKVILDHIDFVCSLESDPKEVATDYLLALMETEFFPVFADHHVLLVLRKNGLVDALQLVKQYFQKHQIIANEEAVLEAIVHSENVTLLQEFMEIFNLVNGERGALLKLSFALYKEQKFPQAKRVLNVPGMRCDNEKAFNFCQKLLEENNFLALDKFCEDANCLFGISKEDLIHYKVLGLVESGQQSVALDYYNQLVNQDILLERKTTEIFARLYQSMGLEFPDKSFILAPPSSNAETAETALEESLFFAADSTGRQLLLEGHMSKFLRTVENGVTYSSDLYSYALKNHFALNSDVSSDILLDALVQGNNISALTSVGDKERLGIAYIRRGQVADLFDVAKQSTKPDEYLTTASLQHLSLINPDAMDSVKEFATEFCGGKGVDDIQLYRNFASYVASTNHVGGFEELVASNPLLLEDPFISLHYVGHFPMLLALSKIATTKNSKVKVYDKLKRQALKMKSEYLVEFVVSKIQEDNLAPKVISSEDWRVIKDVVGKNMFQSQKIDSDTADNPKLDSDTEKPKKQIKTRRNRRTRKSDTTDTDAVRNITEIVE